MSTGYYITGFLVIPMGSNVTTCFLKIELFKYQGGGGGGGEKLTAQRAQ